MILPPFCMVVNHIMSECFAFRWWFVAQRKAEVNGKKLLHMCFIFLIKQDILVKYIYWFYNKCWNIFFTPQHSTKNLKYFKSIVVYDWLFYLHVTIFVLFVDVRVKKRKIT